MKKPLPTFVLPLLLGAAMLSGCSKLFASDPAAEATRAQSALQSGDLASASRHIKLALAERDDVADYWVLAGRIAVSRNDLQAGYIAYQNALTLDRANLEALQALCRLGPGVASPDEVDRYADQLLLLQPNNLISLAAKGATALQRDDLTGALGFTDRVLGVDPFNVNGLVLKAQILVRQQRQSEAGPLLEHAIKSSPSDAAALLSMLVRLYAFEIDRPNYMSAVARLADQRKDDPDTQLAYIDVLYETGQFAAAHDRVIALMQRRPNDIGTQQAILELWLTQGRGATPLDQLITDGRGVSMLMRSAFGAYANAMGRPDLTRQLLALAVANSSIAAPDLDAKAVYAEALAMSGDAPRARQLIAQVLSADPNQPKALLARSRIALAAGDSNAALTDARQVVANDPSYVTAQLLLADILERRGEKALVIGALRQGLDASPTDPRLTQRIALELLEEGRGVEASDAMREAAQRAPVSMRLTHIRNELCGRTGVADCNKAATTSRILQST
jgi:predicted Zn-dependent protease